MGLNGSQISLGTSAEHGMGGGCLSQAAVPCRAEEQCKGQYRLLSVSAQAFDIHDRIPASTQLCSFGLDLRAATPKQNGSDALGFWLLYFSGPILL